VSEKIYNVKVKVDSHCALIALTK